MPRSNECEVLNQTIETFSKSTLKRVSTTSSDTFSSQSYEYVSPDDLKKIKRIRQEHNAALGLPKDFIPPVAPNYDVVFERFNWEKAIETGDPSTIEICRANLKKNLETAINEWLGRSQIEIHYHIENNQIVADGDTTPLGEKIKRGVAMRKLDGSKDLDREKAESVAFLYIIESTLTDPHTPLGTKIVSLSPPSLKSDSPYQSAYVDVWELREVDGQRQIICTRNSTNLSLIDYISLAKEFDPQLKFDSTLPFDAQCLANPFIIHNTAPSLETKGLSPGFCDKVQKGLGLLPDSLISDIEETNVNWLTVAKRINTLRYQVQEISDKLKTSDNWQAQSVESIRSRLTPNEQMIIFGSMQSRQVVSGCGSAPSYNIRNELIKSANPQENSVSQFASDSENYEDLTCEYSEGCTNSPRGKCTKHCNYHEKQKWPHIFA